MRAYLYKIRLWFIQEANTLTLQKGISLIEVLVAITIIGIFGLIASDLMIRSLKANNKARLISQIKQNGQSALITMEDYIRNADSILCVQPGVLTMVSRDGSTTRFWFANQSANSNSYIRRDILLVSIQPLNPDDFCNNEILPSSFSISTSQILTSKNVATGVTVENLVFTKSASPGSTDIVTIEFDLSPPKNAKQSFEYQIDPIHFDSTVKLLNY